MELTLPYELLHHILGVTLADCVHQICFPKSPDSDLNWELNALTTLSLCSRDFRDITVDICQKMYGPPDEGMSLVRSAKARLKFMQSSAKLELSVNPIIFDEDLIKTPFLHWYLLLLSTIQMRRFMKVPTVPELFRLMNAAVQRSFDTIQARRFQPTEMFTTLSVATQLQQELISLSFHIVHEAECLKGHLSELQNVDPKQSTFDSGAHVHLDLIGAGLYSIQGYIEQYTENAAIALHLTGPEVNVHELPGVMDTLKRIPAVVESFEHDDAFHRTVIMDVLDEIMNDWPTQNPTEDIF